jgi:acyl transferase domain-containing protein
VILEEAPAAEQPEVQPSSPRLAAWPLLLSAKSAEALKGQAERLREHVQAHPDLALVELAYSLAITRTRFEHRAAIVADSREGLLAALDALAQGRPEPQTVLGRARGAGKLAFVFPGQGSQWQGMALSLLETSPVFRTQIEACDTALAPHVDWSLLSVLHSEDKSLLDRIDMVQPALFAVMVALAAVWRAIGVSPDAVVGHSQGEVAAAVVAGALSLEDGAKIVALRSQALNRLAGKGGMIAVELGVEALREHLSKWEERLSIAAINSPQSTLVSGDAEILDAVIADLTAAEIFARKIRVDYASHCVHVEAVRDDLLDKLAGLSPRAAELPLYSTVTGAIVEGSELDADYWYRNLRQIVRFGEATEGLLAGGFRCFVEVSPHPVLTLALQETLEPAQGIVVGSLRRDEGGQSRLLLSLAELYTRGLAFDWPAFFGPHAPRRVDLPTYAFQRERFWREAPRQRAADLAAAGQSAAKHPCSPPPLRWPTATAFSSPDGCRWPSIPGWRTMRCSARRSCPAPPSSRWRSSPPSGPASTASRSSSSRSLSRSLPRGPCSCSCQWERLMATGGGPCRSMPGPRALARTRHGPAMPAACSRPAARPPPSICANGRRPPPCRCLLRASMKVWPRPGSPMAPASRACAPPGGWARTCLPKPLSPTNSRPRASPFTRHCSTPPRRLWRWAPMRAPPPPTCPSPGAASRCGPLALPPCASA